MDAGKGKSSDFRLSQALANPGLKKGSSATAASEPLPRSPRCWQQIYQRHTILNSE